MYTRYRREQPGVVEHTDADHQLRNSRQDGFQGSFTENMKIDINLVNTGGSFVLLGRKTKSTKSFFVVFSYFQSATHVYVYRHDDFYERFCIPSFVLKHMFIHTIEQKKIILLFSPVLR